MSIVQEGTRISFVLTLFMVEAHTIQEARTLHLFYSQPRTNYSKSVNDDGYCNRLIVELHSSSDSKRHLFS